ncbi:MAG: hypothetical protein KAG89_16555 [Fulvimarina manganoxydans]|uniref:helix-turn-helix domain-containing protein n=1 Tax=Fulvimarina manganoxydans TaxID=937218 RepID=UPI0023525A65|nr:helix-turn-helix domain-containing protein [Fulvimarina manganoxydans]MCK5933774.1 hypothetical protein [Fulvimarina manganoxydans]
MIPLHDGKSARPAQAASPTGLQDKEPPRSLVGCDLRERGLCRLASAIAATHFGIEIEAIGRPYRSDAATCDARHVAIYLAHVVFQIPLGRTGEAFGRDRSSIAYAIRKIEDRRDDALFDATIGRLEALAHSIGDVVGATGEPGR